MKVLLIDARSGGDWGIDLLFSGLCRVLGPENVLDYPPWPKHRCGIPKLTGDPEKDWGAERASLGYYPGCESHPQYNSQYYQEQIREGKIDYIFIDERRESYELYLSLRANFFKIPVIVVAGHDKFWNVSPQHVHGNYYKENLKYMFLDNWREEYEKLSYARLYNWSCNFDHLWLISEKEKADLRNNKKYDLCFMGYNSHPDRKRFVEHIRKNWGHLNNHVVLEERPNTFDSFVPKYEYFKIMAQSKIVLNFRGAAESGKAMRFWEAPFVGSFLLSQPLENQLFPMLPNAHCSYFDNEEDLDEIIHEALNEPDWREQIAKQGWSHAKQYHCKTVVNYMLKEIQK